MSVAISSTVQLAVGTPCIFIGAVLMLSSLAVNDKSKSGFIAMIVLGAVLFAVGLIVLFLPVQKTNVQPPPSADPLFAARLKNASTLGPAGFFVASTEQVPLMATEPRYSPSALMSRLGASPNLLPAKNGGIRWKDDDKLESVKEFADEESPIAVASAQEQFQAAHEPKPVPARRAMARLGYESASAPVMPNPEQFMTNSFQTAMQSDGALPAGYTRLVPLSDTVETRVRERQEFEAFRDSDSLEAQKHRRYALLREAAWSQPLISRDGLIPILGPNGEDLTQGRCNSIEANSF
jgi:hypothetical protein